MAQSCDIALWGGRIDYSGDSSSTSSFLMLFTRSLTRAMVIPLVKGMSNFFAVVTGAVSQH